ncbi:hypothetical protein O1611_g5265 [Lasiodiplodia mahajangana]|uniref:Uncharacterized protein n=1 Tax=Lasiodiplodia mahajangana TaxID=1108764 RepID=A0ACC2JLT9_9PEZI|nr:hypothetical protein O1611_g5265 [Lasiodiplodia mahajangana]
MSTMVDSGLIWLVLVKETICHIYRHLLPSIFRVVTEDTTNQHLQFSRSKTNVLARLLLNTRRPSLFLLLLIIVAESSLVDGAPITPSLVRHLDIESEPPDGALLRRLAPLSLKEIPQEKYQVIMILIGVGSLAVAIISLILGPCCACKDEGQHLLEDSGTGYALDSREHTFPGIPQRPGTRTESALGSVSVSPQPLNRRDDDVYISRIHNTPPPLNALGMAQAFGPIDHALEPNSVATVDIYGSSDSLCPRTEGTVAEEVLGNEFPMADTSATSTQDYGGSAVVFDHGLIASEAHDNSTINVSGPAVILVKSSQNNRVYFDLTNLRLF